MLVYPATIDLSSKTLVFVSGRVAAHRRVIGSRWRKLPAGQQTLLVLAHLRCADTDTRLAAGFGVGVATWLGPAARDARDLLVGLIPRVRHRGDLSGRTAGPAVDCRCRMRSSDNARGSSGRRAHRRAPPNQPNQPTNQADREIRRPPRCHTAALSMQAHRTSPFAPEAARRAPAPLPHCTPTPYHASIGLPERLRGRIPLPGEPGTPLGARIVRPRCAREFRKAPADAGRVRHARDRTTGRNGITRHYSTPPETPSSPLLIRGFGVRVPGGAPLRTGPTPVLTWSFVVFEDRFPRP